MNERFDDLVERIGIPVEIEITVTADETTNGINLRSDDYDINGDGNAETAPFANYSLMLKKVDLEVGTITGDVSLIIDGTVAYKTSASGASISETIDAETQWGKLVKVRGKIEIAKSAAPSASATTKIWGLLIPNTL